jgi:nucleoid-associated protein YgaU
MAVTLYSRYYGLDTVTIDGQPSLAERPIPPIVDYPDSLLHVVKAGETLDLLAFVYYGREDLWWRIADANPTRFPLDWAPGDTVVIPPLRVATRTAGR